MTKNNYFEGLKIGLGILTVFLVLFGLIYAAGFHYANEIIPGDFQTGDYSFNGKLGVGTTTPSEKLSVNGTIESIGGGFKFPDGSIQVSAMNSGFNFSQCRTLSDSILLQDGVPGCNKGNYGTCQKIVSCNSNEYLLSYNLEPYSAYWYGGFIDTFYGIRNGENSLTVNIGSHSFWYNSGGCSYSPYNCGSLEIKLLCCQK